MDIGLGLDFTLGLGYEEQALLAAEAARLGYQSVWTPEGNGEDAFQICALRWQGSTAAVAGGIGTGIAVSPVALRTPMGFAMSAGTLSKLTGGKFILGIGSSGAHMPAYRAAWGLQGRSVLGLMREYLTAIRGLVRGEKVTLVGEDVVLRGASLGISPAPMTPVYLAALGPEMLRLGAELADGVSLNWCSADQVTWSRQVVTEAAQKAGRDPAAVRLTEYIRVCIDDDEQVARRAFARAVLGYALGPQRRPGERAMGYRAHFDRMGFAEPLAMIDAMRERGVSQDELAAALPDDLLSAVGYFGPAAGAAAAFKRLAQGLDNAIVRVVPVRPGIESTRAVMLACRPELSGAV